MSKETLQTGDKWLPENSYDPDEYAGSQSSSPAMSAWEMEKVLAAAFDEGVLTAAKNIAERLWKNRNENNEIFVQFALPKKEWQSLIREIEEGKEPHGD